MNTFTPSLFLEDDTHTALHIGMPQNITAYDHNNDGFALFNLTVNSERVLSGLAAGAYAIAYFEDEKDARQNRLAFENPEKYYNMFPMTERVYIRVSEISTPENYAIASFTITARQQL
jgi:hypothetical protein